MKRLYMSTYSYKANLDEDAFRRLVKSYGEFGVGEGIIGHFERLDGKGGVLIMEVPEDDRAESVFERTLVYAPFLDFEVVPVTPFEDALPTILKLYG